jgi:hypothetical protein
MSSELERLDDYRCGHWSGGGGNDSWASVQFTPWTDTTVGVHEVESPTPEEIVHIGPMSVRRDDRLPSYRGTLSVIRERVAIEAPSLARIRATFVKAGTQ